MEGITYPLVSIALCTYNGEKYIREQLNSLVKQDYPNLEIIAVDDRSTDSTVAILNEYSAVHDNLKVFINDINLGYKKNFEKAIQLCNGEYIALSDQDDIWELDKISKLINNIEGAVLIYHDSKFINQNGESINKKMSNILNMYSGKNPEAFIFFNSVSSHAVLFHKRLQEYLFDFPDSGYHDSWIAYVAANVGDIKYYNDCLVSYRQHLTSSTDILKRKSHKVNTNKYQKYQENLSFIRYCCDFSKNRHQFVIDKLLALYSIRQEKAFNYQLFFFLLKNKEMFFPIYKKGRLSVLNFAFKQSKRI